MGWNCHSSVYRRVFSTLLFLLALIGLGAHKTLAQANYAILENQYIRVKLGDNGTENNQTVVGRFVVEDIQAKKPILYGPTTDLTGVATGIPVPGSFVTVRIDGGSAAGPTGFDLIFGAAGVGGATAESSWLLQPTVLNNKIVARWGTLPGTNPANALIPIPPIEVTVEITLVHDMACFKFTVINGIVDPLAGGVQVPGTSSHSVGLRFAQNYSPPSFTANEGPVFLSNGGQISTETTLIGSQIPSSWRVYESTFTDTAGGLLKPLTSDPSFIPPDMLVFGSSTMLNDTGNIWDYIPTGIPGFNFAKDFWDAAAGVYFNPRSYSPGEQQTLTTYFGKQHSTIDFSSPWGAGVDGPLKLTYDPTKAVGAQLTPSPFVVTGFVQNSRDVILGNVTGVINLPKGLALAATETSVSKSVPSLGPGSEAAFSWQVVPTGEASGRLRYSVSFSAGPGVQGKTVVRDIDIPALPTQPFVGGIQMVTFPYIFSDATPPAALGLTQTDFDLLKWNPVLGQYEAVTRIVPGEGYWLRLASNKTIALKNGAPVATTTTPTELRLVKGWQQIGNPYLLTTRWADVQVINTDASDPNYLTPATIDEAAQRGWILPTLYRYDTNDQVYKYDDVAFAELIPFQGYWVKSLKDNISLLVPPFTGRSAKLPVATTSRAITPNNWAVRLMATSAHSADTWNFFGVASGASDAFDLKDYEKPPAVQGSISLGFVHGNWGSRAGAYTQDIQSAGGGKKQWNALLTSPQPNTDVTISWPDIAKLPKGYELYITDVSTGHRTLMRQTLSMKVNTGAAASRAFVISAEPRGAQNALLLTGNIITGRGAGSSTATIAVNTTQDASISVRIMGASGNTIRNLVQGRAATSSSDTTFVWDYRDNKGASLPTGTYTIEIKGTTPDGQSAKQILTHTIVR
jgi:hypothetical protein